MLTIVWFKFIQNCISILMLSSKSLNEVQLPLVSISKYFAQNCFPI